MNINNSTRPFLEKNIFQAYFRCGPVPSLNARVIEMPYRDLNMTMFILLPNKCNGLSDLLDRLTSFDVNQLRGQKYSWVGLTLPLFNIGYSVDLDQALLKVYCDDVLMDPLHSRVTDGIGWAFLFASRLLRNDRYRFQWKWWSY